MNDRDAVLVTVYLIGLSQREPATMLDNKNPTQDP